jgi:peptidoglycan/LPS O-acetylase OafA/YrhL
MRQIGMALCLDWAMTNYKGRVGRFLNSRLMIFLGTISFSVYLWQQLFISPHAAARAPYNLIALGFVALASYYWIEQPGIAAGRAVERWIATGRDFAGSDKRVRQSTSAIVVEQS